MKIWVDDVRPEPEGYVWCKSVNDAKKLIRLRETRIALLDLGDAPDKEYKEKFQITLIDLDHDAGDYANDGGDYVKLLDWLEETGRNYPIRIHSMNPVGVANMRAIIKRNGWTEVM